jgi:hypothetical protein
MIDHQQHPPEWTDCQREPRPAVDLGSPFHGVETSTGARARLATLFAIGLTNLAIACGDQGDSTSASDTGDGPLYAMMIQVYDPEDRTVYVSLSDSLDVDSVPLSDAREFPGVANLAVIGGRLLVSSGSAPEITEFDITSHHDWVEGRRVSFASYPLSDNANFYYQFIVDHEHALLPFDGTKRILWNPSEMVIDRLLEDTTLTPSEPGLTLESGGNRNSVQYAGAVMQTYFYHDDDWYDYGSKSHVVVYDATTFSEKRIFDVPCPGLTIATRDEGGSTYFSNWGLPSPSITGDAPATCLAKVSPAQTAVETFDLREWTDGRWVSNFRYVGNGKAFANVLHHEALGVTSPGELTSEQLDTLRESGPHWKLWLFDVAQKTGAPVGGIDVAIADGAQMAVLDDRSFVFLPYDDWGRTKAYELMTDGTAVERFDTVGDVFKWARVR